jgi:hypothetical protein
MEHERGAFKVNRATMFGAVKNSLKNGWFGCFRASGCMLHRKTKLLEI